MLVYCKTWTDLIKSAHLYLKPPLDIYLLIDFHHLQRVIVIVRTNQSDMDPEKLSQYVQEIIEENQDLFGVEIHDITYGMPIATSTHALQHR